MFKKKNYRKVVISILALTMIFGTVAFAAEGIYNKQLTATYGRIKFNYQGSDVTSQIEGKYGTPAFTVSDRAYAPVRSIADLLGVDIDYDHKTHTAKITDPKAQEYKIKLDEKDKEIAKLKKEVEELKKEEKKEEVTKTDLKDLQKALNDKYHEYEQVEFDIVLTESKNDITVKIDTDLTKIRDEQNWIRMRSSDKKYLIEDIVKQVRKEFPSSDVEGRIYDSSSKKDLYTFRQTKSGSLSISDKDYIGDRGRYDDYYYDGDIDDEVDYQFRREGIRDAKLTRLTYSGRTAYFEIDFTDKYVKEWDKLSTGQIEDMLDYIAHEIEYYYSDGDYVEGKIYIDGELEGRYDKEYRYSGKYR